MGALADYFRSPRRRESSKMRFSAFFVPSGCPRRGEVGMELSHHQVLRTRNLGSRTVVTIPLPCRTPTGPRLHINRSTRQREFLTKSRLSCSHTWSDCDRARRKSRRTMKMPSRSTMRHRSAILEAIPSRRRHLCALWAMERNAG